MNAKKWSILAWLLISMVLMIVPNEAIAVIGFVSCGICVLVGHTLAEKNKL